MCCLEGRHFFRAQGYSLISIMVNPALIVPLTNMAHATVKLSIKDNSNTLLTSPIIVGGLNFKRFPWSEKLLAIKENVDFIFDDAEERGETLRKNWAIRLSNQNIQLNSQMQLPSCFVY